MSNLHCETAEMEHEDDIVHLETRVLHSTALNDLSASTSHEYITGDGSSAAAAAALVPPTTTHLPSFPCTFPAEKRIPGTRFVVDGFRHAGPWSSTYFLSHFHSDHYTGLTSFWNKGLIFCSQITANLIIHHLNVLPSLVIGLPLRRRTMIDGCEVTLVDANHCPGAVQLLFKVRADGKHECGFRRYVHTGDMRYDASFENDSRLCDFVGADAIFLDTTYCNPRFVFPSQQDSIDYIAGIVFKLTHQELLNGKAVDNTLQAEEEDGDSHIEPIAEGHTDSRTLFLIATYVIGKEKILLKVAKQCKCLIYVNEKKLALLKCLNLEDHDVFTSNSELTNVHVVGWNFLGDTWPYFKPNFPNMEKAMQQGSYSRVVGFVPTGWTYELKKKMFSVRKKGPFEIHLVPYSEHSNYNELRDYVKFLRPHKIIPTVGLEGEGLDGKAVVALREHFRNLVDETASKRKFLKDYNRKTSSQGSIKLEPTCTAPVSEDHCKEEMAPKDDIVSQHNGQTVGVRVPNECSEELKHDDQNFLKDGMRGNGEEVRAQTEEAGSTPLHSQQKYFGAGFGRNARKRMKASTDGNLKESPDISDSVQMPIQAISLSQGLATSELLNDVVNESCASSTQGLCDQDENSQNDLELRAREQIGVMYPCGAAETLENAVHSQPACSSGSLCDCYHAMPVTSSETTSVTDFWAQDPSRDSTSRLSDTPLAKKRRKLTSNASTTKKSGGIQLVSEISPISARDRVKQSSMLKFFKKVTEGAGCGAEMDVPETSTDASMFERDQCQLAVHNGGQASQNFPKLTHWKNEINQLTLVLDGSISTDLAILLLEKAGGDVGIALDLFDSENKNKVTTLSDNICKDSVATGGTKNICNESLYFVRNPEESLMDLDSQAMTQTLHGSVMHSHSLPRSTDAIGSVSLVPYTVNISARLPLEEAGSVATPVRSYLPINDACWKVGEPAPYLHLARAFELVEHESGRLKTIDMLCNMFRSLLALAPEAVLPALYLSVNRIAPDYEHADLNIGGTIVAAAISEVAGVSRAKLKEMYTSMGDLGDVAQACRQKQSTLKLPEHLSICLVFSTLRQISKESGSGSVERKKKLVVNLLRACREKETKYIVRTLVQNMRIGAMMNSVLSGLAQAVFLHHAYPIEQALEKPLAYLQNKFHEASASVLEAYNFLPNLDVLVPSLFMHGIAGLADNYSMAPGTPIKPMLAKITNGIEDLVAQFIGRAFTCEYKYDGQRAQIHMLPDGSIRIFSRSSEETTARFPDVVEIVKLSANKCTKSFIIDTEVVAIDRSNGIKLMPFQHLSTRGWSTNSAPVDVHSNKVDICVFAFDVMYVNDQSVVNLPLIERRKRLQGLFPIRTPGCFELAKEITVEPGRDSTELVVSSKKVAAFLEEAIAASCEGIMAKALGEDSAYRASKRSDSWLKMKRDYVDGLSDTLDLVPIGAWNGNGRKAGWYSPFLLACYDPEREEYQSVCRVMSGFTDSFYKAAKEYFSNHLLPQKPPYYRTLEEPDVWFTAEAVWEIRGADYTISPLHQAAIGYCHPSRGISMRFPRFVHIRSDKRSEDASSPSEIAELYNKQSRKLEF